MQDNLESWEQQLKEICAKKAKNGEHRIGKFAIHLNLACYLFCADSLQMTELERRNGEIASFTEQLKTETALRQSAESHRDALAEQLV